MATFPDDPLALAGLHVVVIGNPVDGVTLFGPFKTGEDALAWAENEVSEDWWITPLEHPDDYVGGDDDSSESGG